MPKLAEVASAIRPGDVVACRGKGAMDWLIDHVTGSDYSHVAIVLEPGEDPTLLQAMGIGEARGVHTAPLSSLLASDACDWLATSLEWSTDADAFARAFVGKPYSYLADVEVALDLQTFSHQEICSVLVAQVMTYAGLSMSKNGQTPGRVVDDLLKQDAILRRVYM